MNRAVSRRSLIRLSAGLVSAAIAGGLLRPQPGARAANAEPLSEPELRSSDNGLLQTSLDARVIRHSIAGVPAVTPIYEGTFPGPTLRVRPGDVLKVHLSNNLDGITNLHTHGLHVSPSGNSDNVLLHIDPGTSFDYEYRIPADHPAGFFWYHPHHHGLTTEQLSGGMAGALIVEGDLDRIPGIAGLSERLLIFHATQLNANGTVTDILERQSDKFLRSVNGQRNPTLTIRPGETQRWRLGNFSAATWFRIRLDGHTLYQIAKDGNTYDQVVARDEIIMAPAERVEVLVQGAAAGTYALRTLVFDQGFSVQPEETLATVVSSGEPQTRQELPSTLLPFEDLRAIRMDRQRSLTFQILPSEQPGNGNFEINSQHFNPNRVDFEVPLNAAEEWVIANATPVWHPFHIHINPFQVVNINGKPVTESHSYEDTVSVPPKGEVRIRTRFLDFTGTFVLHCHILPHEDGGMMSVVQVVGPNGPDGNTTHDVVFDSGPASPFECALPVQ